MTFKEAKDAYNKAVDDGKVGQEMVAVIRDWFLSTTTTNEIIYDIGEEIYGTRYEGIEGLALSWEEMFERALLLAKNQADCLSVKRAFDCGCEDYYCDHFLKVCERMLALAKDKGDVEEILRHIYSHQDLSLKEERIFLAIFKRGHEVPERQPTAEDNG